MCLRLKHRLIFLRVLKVFYEHLGESDTETSRNISRYFKRRHLIIYLLSNSKKILPLGFKSNRKKLRLPQCQNLHEPLELQIFWRGSFFLGGFANSGGKIFRILKMFVFAVVIMFLTFVRRGVKFSRWGKTSLGGVQIYQVSTSTTVKYAPNS